MKIDIALNPRTKMVIDTKSIRKGCCADNYIPGHIAIEYEDSYWGATLQGLTS